LPVGAGGNHRVFVHGQLHVRLDPRGDAGNDPGEGTRDSTAERRTNRLSASPREIS